MQILIDSPEIQKELIRIRTYAIDNIFDFTNGIPKNQRPAVHNPNHVFTNGTLIVENSVEKHNMRYKEQKETKLDYFHHLVVSTLNAHHLSISTLNRKLPNPEIINPVLKMFNMSSLNDEGKIREIWIENNNAVNIIELMEVN